MSAASQDQHTLQELQELDTKFVELFEALGEWRDEKAQVDECVRRGRWCIADARHRAGSPGLLRADAYEGRVVSPTVRFAGDDLELDMSVSHSCPEVLPLETSVRRFVLGDDTLRQRRPVRGNGEEDADSAARPRRENDGEDRGPAAEIDLSEDPLKWFGLLLPPEVEEAQARFRDAVGRAARAASLQRRIRSACADIERIRKR